MNKKILVHIYAYKESQLLNIVDSLISNAYNPEQVDIYIDDQHNLTRYSKFIPYKNVFYNPVWWDELTSPLAYRASCLDVKFDQYEYCLFLNKETYLNKNWDVDLMRLLPDNAIFSGKGSVKCSVDKNFYIMKERSESDNITLTNIVDNNFIFCKMSDIRKITFPINLKYYGIDEYMSIALMNRDIQIYSLPSNYYRDGQDNLLVKDYIPFSLYHNYNEVIDMIKNGSCSRIKYEDAWQFIDFHTLDLDKLFRLPFSFNDIEYNRFSELDLIGGVRYIEKRDSVS